MRIKTQFVVCLVAFTIVLITIGASVANTEQQVTFLNSQQDISHNIEAEASALNSISIDYFLYQENLQVSRWDSKLSSLFDNLDLLVANNAKQQMLVDTVKGDLQNLNEQFDDITAYLLNAPSNLNVRVDPAFQIRWSSIAVQIQTLASDSSQMSKSINDQVQQANLSNILLILSLVVTFGAFLGTIYLMVFRKTLKSVAELQNGIDTIGTGNLDFKISMQGQNEITQLSQAFNQMTNNLKTVTASKTELEKEVLRREQAETALRASEERWATTLASVGDAVIATDMEGKVVFMNKVAEALTGWNLSEARNMPLNKVFHIISEYSRKEVESPVAEVIKKGLVVGLANHTILICKDSTEIPIDDSGAPIRDKNGNVTGVVLVFRDITERRSTEAALRKSEEEYRSLFANMIDGFAYCQMLFDDQGTPKDFIYLQINEAFEKITGLRREQVIGKKVTEAIPGIKKANPELFEIYGRVALTCQKEKFEVFFKPLGLWLSISVYSPLKGCFAAVFEDITERKNTEAKLEEYAKNLEDLVEQRTKALKDSERLAAIGATAGMVGHDIRNPLQAITGDVYLAKTELTQIPASKEKESVLESLQEIEKNTYYINKIVQDLQDFSRPLTPHMEKVSLKVLIDELLSKNGLPDNIKVTVKIENTAEKVVADCTFLNRIIYNLVNNAVQAMPKGGELTIHAYREASDFVICVKDTGVGISEKARSKLFTPMFTTKSKGQGFGLAVIKRMTEALGGSVYFESEESKGTTFTVRFPVKKK